MCRAPSVQCGTRGAAAYGCAGSRVQALRVNFSSLGRSVVSGCDSGCDHAAPRRADPRRVCRCVERDGSLGDDLRCTMAIRVCDGRTETEHRGAARRRGQAGRGALVWTVRIVKPQGDGCRRLDGQRATEFADLVRSCSSTPRVDETHCALVVDPAFRDLVDEGWSLLRLRHLA